MSIFYLDILTPNEIKQDWMQLLRDPNEQTQPIAAFIEEITKELEAPGPKEPLFPPIVQLTKDETKKKAKQTDNSRRIALSFTASRPIDARSAACILAMGVELETEKLLAEHPIVAIRQIGIALALILLMYWSGVRAWNRIKTEMKT